MRQLMRGQRAGVNAAQPIHGTRRRQFEHQTKESIAGSGDQYCRVTRRLWQPQED
jgi:hypothetical protein